MAKTILSNNDWMGELKKFFSRKEVAAAVVALVVGALATLAKALNMPIPEADLNLVTGVAVAAFLMTFFEAGFKPDYGNAWASLLSSTKFKTVALTLVGVLMNDLMLKPFGLTVPPESLEKVGVFLYSIVIGKGGLDAVKIVLSSPKLK